MYKKGKNTSVKKMKEYICIKREHKYNKKERIYFEKKNINVYKKKS